MISDSILTAAGWIEDRALANKKNYKLPDGQPLKVYAKQINFAWLKKITSYVLSVLRVIKINLQEARMIVKQEGRDEVARFKETWKDWFEGRQIGLVQVIISAPPAKKTAGQPQENERAEGQAQAKKTANNERSEGQPSKSEPSRGIPDVPPSKGSPGCVSKAEIAQALGQKATGPKLSGPSAPKSLPPSTPIYPIPIPAFCMPGFAPASPAPKVEGESKVRAEGEAKVEAHRREASSKLRAANETPRLLRASEVLKPSDGAEQMDANSFLHGLLKLQYFHPETYNSMGQFIGHGNFLEVQEKVRIARAAGTLSESQKGEFRAELAAAKARMGYDPDVVGAIMRIKYPAYNLVRNDGSFMVADPSRDVSQMAYVSMLQVGLSPEELREEQALGTGLSDHHILSRKMFNAVQGFIKKNQGQLPKKLSIRFSNAVHTMLLVIERDAAKPGNIHLSVIDSFGDNGADYGKKGVLNAAKKALVQTLGMREENMDVVHSSVDQNNDHACGIHVDRNEAQLMNDPRPVYEILKLRNRGPISNATGPILPYRDSTNLRNCLNEDIKLARQQYNEIFNGVSEEQKTLLRRSLEDYEKNMAGEKRMHAGQAIGRNPPMMLTEAYGRLGI